MYRSLRTLFILFIGLASLSLSTQLVFSQSWINSVTATTTNTTATINWVTAVPANTQVKYGTTTSYEKRSTLSSTLVTKHSATLSSLTASTLYHFRVLSADSSGVLVTSVDYTFTTQSGPVSVSISPTTATLASGGTQQFSATVTNSSNKSVNWSTTAGTVSTTGLFTAPSVTSNTTATLTATSVANTTKSACATITVKAPVPILAVTPTSLTFSAQQGGSNPASSSVSITNTGGGTLTFSITTDAAWLTVSPTSGTAPATLQVTAGISGLAAGTYTGHITVTAKGATNSPATITVSLAISAASVQHTVALSWTESTSSDVVDYNAYRSLNSGGPYSLIASAITAVTYTDQTVQSGTTYYYVATAVDNTGQESAYSNEATAVVPSP